MDFLQLDHLDRIAAESFEGYIVRKDLALKLKGQYPVPTYVGEFLLGRYCSSTDEEEIRQGLAIVERQMRERTVRAGEEELYKAREQGSVGIIDLITARLDSRTDSYLATLPSLRLNDVRIEPELVSGNERMLTGGFYAEVELEYDAIVAQEKGGHPFGVASLRPIQLSTRDALQELSRGREAFTTVEWKRFLLRSIGLEPDALSERAQDIMLLSMVPFVERNYNMVELGPRAEHRGGGDEGCRRRRVRPASPEQAQRAGLQHQPVPLGALAHPHHEGRPGARATEGGGHDRLVLSIP